MDNLRQTLEVLFCKMEPSDVIRQWLKEDSIDYTVMIPQEMFVNRSEILQRGQNKDELNAVYKLAFSVWNNTPDTLLQLGYKKQQNIFFILVKFVREVLCEIDETPVCRFQHLLRWRDISLKLGEDILTTVFFAYKDISCERERHFFSWPSVVSTDNSKLQELLSKGVTDLHFHLVGSSLNFDIGWIDLMNNIKNRKKDFLKMQSLRNPYTKTSLLERNQWTLYTLSVKACAIRQLLFRLLIKEITLDCKEKSCFYEKILSCETEQELCLYIVKLQDINERLKLSYGRIFFNRSSVDYAIKNSISCKNENLDYSYNMVLYGERWMMYKMFRVIFQQKTDDRFVLKPLFYAYLLIKIKIRNEFVQVNNYVGFQNFKNYQDRKTLFVKPFSIYEKLLVNLAINNCIRTQNVKYLEVRIPPKRTVEENTLLLLTLDNFAENNYNTVGKDHNHCSIKPFYYVFHFLKEADSWNSAKGIFFQPRHAKLREKIKEQAHAINLIRQHYNIIKNRIVGIDVAGAEIGCRPEVFAQTYRYLKKYSYELEHHFFQDEDLGALGFTYHVGEDFLDISDGMRAIEEVILFLNFRNGDRLGHCLALGVTPELFYKQKNYHIIIQKQDLLDNIVWLIMQIKKYDIKCPQSLLLDLHQKYEKLFSDIFCSEKESSTTEKLDSPYYYHAPYNIYYMSWLLRGDNPYLYITANSMTSHPILNYWDMCGENRFDNIFDEARNDEHARNLYFRYHFDENVRRLGCEYIEYKITKDYMNLIRDVQNAFMQDIAIRQISIECNPTSNKLIGGYNMYSELPIKRFFNSGLTYDYTELSQCPQLSISINTDDLGIFSTSISNEYALMAIAMEKENNNDGTKKYNTHMIYDWLENIRKMGFKNRFTKKNCGN